MGPKVRTLAALLLAVAPSATLAWTWRAMPQLDLYRDDAIYWVCAKSLGAGAGYKIASLPAQPWQTKYPPLFPAWLSLVWRIDQHFPDNLKLATLFVWLAVPAWLLLFRAWLKQMGMSEWQSAVLVLCAGFNPVACVLGITPMSELPFTALLLACLILAERAAQPGSSKWLASAGGLLAGFAYLTRCTALPLLVTVPFCLALRSRWKRAAAFAVSMVPFVAAWQWWVARHLSPARDPITLYYTDYMGYQMWNVRFSDLPLVVWHNSDAVARSIGKLLTFDLTLDSKILERIVAVAAIAGVVRFARRTGYWQYPAAALSMTALLLVWHFPPNERFVMPMYPLLALGLFTELRNLAATLRRAWTAPKTSERAAAAVAGLALASFAGFIVVTHIGGDFILIPTLLRKCETDLRAHRPAYDWMARNTSPAATLYADQDPLAWLYAGRRACSLPVPPKLFRDGDRRSVEQFASTMPALVQEQRLDYVLLTDGDYYLDFDGPNLRAASARSVARSAAFHEVFATPETRVYRAAP